MNNIIPAIDWLSQGFISYSTQNRSFWRRSSQPISRQSTEETKCNTTKASNTMSLYQLWARDDRGQNVYPMQASYCRALWSDDQHDNVLRHVHCHLAAGPICRRLPDDHPCHWPSRWHWRCRSDFNVPRCWVFPTFGGSDILATVGTLHTAYMG